MITMWKAHYEDGSYYEGPKYDLIDRKKLVRFDVTYGPQPERLATFSLEVPYNARLLWRHRKSARGLDFGLLAIETKDSRPMGIFQLFVNHQNEPDHLELPSWGAPNLWRPELMECEV